VSPSVAIFILQCIIQNGFAAGIPNPGTRSQNTSWIQGWRQERRIENKKKRSEGRERGKRKIREKSRRRKGAK